MLHFIQNTVLSIYSRCALTFFGSRLLSSWPKSPSCLAFLLFHEITSFPLCAKHPHHFSSNPFLLSCVLLLLIFSTAPFSQNKEVFELSLTRYLWQILVVPFPTDFFGLYLPFLCLFDVSCKVFGARRFFFLLNWFFRFTIHYDYITLNDY